ncbi:MAG TPA: hypothetical protein VNW46_08005 [Gemmatimonadaceae bacterium]|jgi:hypothetical protein|nr:hypothetical protein [Gemmatimonadaceae bacterium]
MLRILRTLVVGLTVGLVLVPLGLVAVVIGLPLLLLAALVGAPLLFAAAVVMAVLALAAGLVVAVVAGKIMLFIVFPIWLVVEITRSLRRPRVHSYY